MKLRQDTPLTVMPDYMPAEAYTDNADPGPDDRRAQMLLPATDPDRATPESEHQAEQLDVEHDDPTPYQEPQPPPVKLAAGDVLPNDAQARTVIVGDEPVVILSDDPERVAWCFYVHADSPVGVRYALGRNARQDAEQIGHSAPLTAAEGTLRGTFTGTVAAVAATPGQLATVVVLTERDTRR